ncbi:cytochrome b-c1 complex subunit 9 [Podospora conica]|nr:cytochrome b-c1 complex subunit 9 [Schizothecium conicum]
MALANSSTYNFLFRKNWVFVGTVFAGAFGFEIFYNSTMNKVWDNLNRGRQWKDIRHKYAEAEESDE